MTATSIQQIKENIEKFQTGEPNITINKMAIARPIRVLGLVAIGLWVFFLYQIFGPARIPKGPGDSIKNLMRDPNLDREFQSLNSLADANV